MDASVIKSWKKVCESDISYLFSELNDTLEKPALISFTGVVGAGKTTFIKSFSRWLLDQHKMIKVEVTSPTYSLLNDYGLILHGDFYRLKDSSEIVDLDLELSAEGKDYFLLEWGKEHYQALQKVMPSEWNFFDLTIESPVQEHRNYTLTKFKRELF